MWQRFHKLDYINREVSVSIAYIGDMYHVLAYPTRANNGSPLLNERLLRKNVTRTLYVIVKGVLNQLNSFAGPILHRLGDMGGLDLLGASEVGDGAG